jgi:DNA-directed RNA polymerase
MSCLHQLQEPPPPLPRHHPQVNYLKLKERYGDRVLASLRENGQLSLKRVNRKAKEALGDGLWSPDLKIKVGGMLLNELHRVATISAEGAGEGEGDGGEWAAQGAAEAVASRPAFRLELEGVGGLKRRGMLLMDAALFARMAAGDDEELRQFLTPRYRPMVVEPRRWRGVDAVRAGGRAGWMSGWWGFWGGGWGWDGMEWNGMGACFDLVV